jgi:DNA-binding phage protein
LFYYFAAAIKGLRSVIFKGRYNSGQIMEERRWLKSVPFGVVLNHYLQYPEKAVSYLQSALEENDPDGFQLALRDVAEAQGVLTISGVDMPELVASLRRLGVSADTLTATLSEMNGSMDAA